MELHAVPHILTYNVENVSQTPFSNRWQSFIEKVKLIIFFKNRCIYSNAFRKYDNSLGDFY